MDENDEPLTDDPEILALLDFEPVVRKCKRHDGWTPANPRIYILGLAETGNVDAAAQRKCLMVTGTYLSPGTTLTECAIATDPPAMNIKK